MTINLSMFFRFHLFLLTFIDDNEEKTRTEIIFSDPFGVDIYSSFIYAF
jgi:hypothetical protein